jgi:hypothetical protein
VERVFACRRLKTFFAGRWTVGGLVRFLPTPEGRAGPLRPALP